MKRILNIFIAIIIVVLLSACGKTNSSTNTPTETTVSETTKTGDKNNYIINDGEEWICLNDNLQYVFYSDGNVDLNSDNGTAIWQYIERPNKVVFQNAGSPFSLSFEKTTIDDVKVLRSDSSHWMYFVRNEDYDENMIAKYKSFFANQSVLIGSTNQAHEDLKEIKEHDGEWVTFTISEFDIVSKSDIGKEDFYISTTGDGYTEHPFIVEFYLFQKADIGAIPIFPSSLTDDIRVCGYVDGLNGGRPQVYSVFIVE